MGLRQLHSFGPRWQHLGRQTCPFLSPRAFRVNAASRNPEWLESADSERQPGIETGALTSSRPELQTSADERQPGVEPRGTGRRARGRRVVELAVVLDADLQ